MEGHRQHTDAEDQAVVWALSIDRGRRLGQRDVRDADVPEAQAVHGPGWFREDLSAAALEPNTPPIDTAQAYRLAQLFECRIEDRFWPCPDVPPCPPKRGRKISGSGDVGVHRRDINGST